MIRLSATSILSAATTLSGTIFVLVCHTLPFRLLSYPRPSAILLLLRVRRRESTPTGENTSSAGSKGEPLKLTLRQLFSGGFYSFVQVHAKGLWTQDLHLRNVSEQVHY